MSTAEDFKKIGNEHFSAKEYQKAIDAYTKALELKTDHVFYSNRSACYASLQQYDKALEDAENCIKTKPDFIKGYGRKATAYHGMGRYQDALNAYEEAMKVDPSANFSEEIADLRARITGMNNNPMAKMFDHTMFSRLSASPKTAKYMSDPSFVKIMTEIQQNPNALTNYISDPRVTEAFQVLLGIELPPMGGDAAAANTQTPPPQEEPRVQRPPRPAMERDTTPTSTGASVGGDSDNEAEEIDPELEKEKAERAAKKKAADAEKELGTAAYKKKDFDTALAHYTKAFELYEDVVYLMNTTAVYYEKKEYDTTIAKCDEILQNRSLAITGTQKAKVYLRKANALKALSKFEDAISAYKASLIEDNLPAVRKALREAEEAKKKADEEAYLDDEKSEELKNEGNEAVKQGLWPKAIELYTDALRRNPKNYKVYANRALCFQKLMRWDKCIEDCDKCLSFDKTFGKAYLRKGKVLFYLKNYPKALDCYREGLANCADEFKAELMQGIQETQQAIYSQSTGEVDEQRVAEAMKDPEIVRILQDPLMQNVLNEMQTKPEAANKYMQNPEISARIEKLIAAGIIRLG